MNLKTLATRSLSGIVYVMLMVLCTLQGGYIYLLLIVVLYLLLWREYKQLCARITSLKHRVWVYPNLLAVVITVIAFILTPSVIIDGNIPSIGTILICALSILVAVCFYATVRAARQQRIIPQQAINIYLIGLCWITLPMLLLASLRYIHFTLWTYSVYAPLSLFVCIWLNDSAAYLVGSLIGKRSLSPTSPNKTWEGTVGGILVSTLVGGTLFSYLGWITSIVHALMLSLLIGIASTIGDFLESALKRQANVKDSGNIMPGHGGAFDRLDSILISTIFTFLYALIVN